jgi:CubicO group peptidase (beta-lactamase class C family)
MDYDTNINKYLTKWKCPKQVTLQQLLSHSSSLNNVKEGGNIIGYHF